MTYFVIIIGVCFMLGVLAVASNPSPYYGVVGLVLASVIGCGWLVNLGVSFISLSLFIIYLGGMLVVFVYSVSLAADPYPEAWGDWRVVGYGLGFVSVVCVGAVLGGFVDFWKVGVTTIDGGGVSFVRLDMSGVAVFYSWGVGLFLVAG